MKLPVFLFRAFILALILTGGISASVSAQVAFAKASPLNLFTEIDGTTSKPVSFKFGQAYEIFKKNRSWVGVVLDDGSKGFVRRAQMQLSIDGYTVISTSGFKRTKRPRLQFWRNSQALYDFLSHGKVSEGVAELEEKLVNAPDYKLALPIFAEDTVDVVGKEAISIAGVLVKVPADMGENFEAVKKMSVVQPQLHLIIDASYDTAVFAEKAMLEVADFVKTANRDDSTEIQVFITYYGRNMEKYAYAAGRIDVGGLAKPITRPKAPKRKMTGEPLFNGVLTASANFGADGRGSLVVVLAGPNAETKLFGKGARVSDDLSKLTRGLDFIKDGMAFVFAQVTPEPATALNDIANLEIWNNNASLSDFGEGLQEALAEALAKSGARIGKQKLDEAQIAELCKATHRAKTICLLPIGITTETKLPSPPAYVAKPEWYTLPVWVAVNNQVLTISDD